MKVLECDKDQEFFQHNCKYQAMELGSFLLL